MGNPRINVRAKTLAIRVIMDASTVQGGR